MDEVNVRVHTNLMKNAISKVIEKIIFKKLNIETNIDLGDLAISKNDDHYCMHLDVKIYAKDSDVLHKILQNNQKSVKG